MHTEVHVHGNIPLRSGVRLADVEAAIRPWLDYVDVDSVAEATSAREDEPGIAYDPRRRVLEICWSGWVGRRFHEVVEQSLHALSPLADDAAEIEVSYYHDDGRDEYGVVFVGPDPAAIHEAKRRRMVDDLKSLLGRHFNESEVADVVQLVNQLFDARAPAPGTARRVETQAPERVPLATSKKHLH
ncbi:MAG: hypothetical protein N2544_14695 [Burkholderiales bacterium]|nr:hypothetical protein [Burkholderiales bacterium]